VNKVVAFIPLEGEISIKKLAAMYRISESIIRRSLQPLIDGGLLEEVSDGKCRVTPKMGQFQRDAELDSLMGSPSPSTSIH
jgi:DeoR/GlpR family transcriptional regulator of sugar metabolism